MRKPVPDMVLEKTFADCTGSRRRKFGEVTAHYILELLSTERAARAFFGLEAPLSASRRLPTTHGTTVEVRVFLDATW